MDFHLPVLRSNMFSEYQLYQIRTATPDDAKQILSIYAYYVTNTAITFECTVPTLQEFTERITNILQKYPYLVAEENGQIIGYAYASAFHSREAYAHSVEVTVYVAPQMRRAGLGRQLYGYLEELLKKQNVCNLYTCIAYPPKIEGEEYGSLISLERSEDRYLTFDSVRFHEHLGYRMIGEFQNCGYKFNRWYSMVWMEKMIGEHTTGHPEFIPLDKIR